MAEVDPSLQQFAHDVIDGVLARGAALFPDAQQVVELGAGPADAGGPPGSGEALSGRLEEAASQWARRRLAIQHLDEQRAQIMATAAAAAVEGRAAVERLREQARAQVDTIMPLTDSPAGGRLLVSMLDQIVGQLQQHIADSMRANAEAAAQLRELTPGIQAASDN